jgi:hypothetical protein
MTTVKIHVNVWKWGVVDFRPERCLLYTEVGRFDWTSNWPTPPFPPSQAVPKLLNEIVAFLWMRQLLYVFSAVVNVGTQNSVCQLHSHCFTKQSRWALWIQASLAKHPDIKKYVDRGPKSHLHKKVKCVTVGETLAFQSSVYHQV